MKARRINQWWPPTPRLHIVRMIDTMYGRRIRLRMPSLRKHRLCSQGPYVGSITAVQAASRARSNPPPTGLSGGRRAHPDTIPQQARIQLFASSELGPHNCPLLPEPKPPHRPRIPGRTKFNITEFHTTTYIQRNKLVGEWYGVAATREIIIQA